MNFSHPELEKFDRAERKAIISMAEYDCTHLGIMHVNIRHGDEGPGAWTREEIEITDDMRRVAREM